MPIYNNTTPANPSSWSSSSAWSPITTGLRGLPAGTLQAWYDANSPANKVAFLSLGDNVNMAGSGWSYAASGNVNSNVLVFNNNYLTAYFGNNNVLSVYPQVQLGADANIYQLVRMLNSNSFAVSPNLKATYVNQSVHVNSVIGVSDLSGNGRHLYSNMSLSNLSPFMAVFEQAGYFAVSYYPGWVNGQPLTGTYVNNNPNYLNVNGQFCVSQTQDGWGGPFAETVVTNSALSTTQRQQLEGYLAAKWNLQTMLPASHPYASSSPNGFTPLSLSPNLMGWYDSNNLGSLFTDSGCSIPAVSGNTIGCFTDQSGNGRHLLQSTAAAQPTYGNMVLGGNLPALNANLGGGFILCTSANASWLSNTNYSIAMVGQLGKVASNTGEFFVSTSNGGSNNTAAAIGFKTVNGENRFYYSQYNSDYAYQINGAPFFNPNSQNNLPGMFYINNTYASSASMDTNTAAYLNNTPYTVALVAQITSLQAQQLVGTSYPINELVNDSILYFFWSDFSQIDFSQQGPNYFVWGTAMSTQTILYVFGSLYPNRTLFSRLNGSLFTGGNASSYFTALSGYFSLGQSNPVRTGLTGNIYESIVLTGNLKTVHFTMLEGYLAHKWGLQSQLPQNHPYRLVAPRK